MVADYVYPSLSHEFQIGPAIASEDKLTTASLPCVETECCACDFDRSRP